MGEDIVVPTLGTEPGNIGVVSLLLERGAFIDMRSEEQGTPLNHAVFVGHTAIISLLLDQGAGGNDDAQYGTDFIIGSVC